jgi:DNA repair protein RadC
MYAKDCAGPYRPAQTANLSALIDTLLGHDLGAAILADLVREAVTVSPQNLRDRLRVAIHSGTLPRLTQRRLEKLQAALELGRQLYVEEVQTGEIVDTPAQAAAVFNCIAWEPVEKFAIACLNTKNRLLSCEVISSGTSTETLVHPREVFAVAMRAGATRLIVAHNHPSSDTRASKDDIKLTEQLLAASKVMGIPILDHLIVSHGKNTSMRSTTHLWKEI